MKRSTWLPIQSIRQIGNTNLASYLERRHCCDSWPPLAHRIYVKHCDGIHFFGVDSGNNWIDVCINKIEENLAIAWIFLKLHNGEEYRLPGGPDLRISYIDNESLFSACGLQIRCLSPLRKWRISFNGLLQQCSGEKDNENATDLVHVKFSFVWLSMSLARESNFDFNPKDLARSFADASNDISYPDLKCFHEFQNNYEQWGHLMGTICLKGKEDNIYLWSCKTRILDNPLWYEEISFSKFYMYFKVGYPIKVETTSVKNFISNYTSAHSVSPTGGLADVTECDFDLNQLPENAKEPQDFLESSPNVSGGNGL
ncbi:phosphoenolpyruvate synthase [Trichonephila clavipes]|nr:phosphoenolpyruvate synthase [Trichonephila clavipes]